MTGSPTGFESAVNGAAMAAFLAAGIGAFATGLLVVLNEAGIFAAPALYGPAGGVTGRTGIAAAIWVIAWAVLHRRWRHRAMGGNRVIMLALILIALAILMTFPPVWSLL